MVLNESVSFLWWKRWLLCNPIPRSESHPEKPGAKSNLKFLSGRKQNNRRGWDTSNLPAEALITNTNACLESWVEYFNYVAVEKFARDAANYSGYRIAVTCSPVGGCCAASNSLEWNDCREPDGARMISDYFFVWSRCCSHRKKVSKSPRTPLGRKFFTKWSFVQGHLQRIGIMINVHPSPGWAMSRKRRFPRARIKQGKLTGRGCCRGEEQTVYGNCPRLAISVWKIMRQLLKRQFLDKKRHVGEV